MHNFRAIKSPESCAAAFGLLQEKGIGPVHAFVGKHHPIIKARRSMPTGVELLIFAIENAADQPKNAARLHINFPTKKAADRFFRHYAGGPVTNIEI